MMNRPLLRQTRKNLTNVFIIKLREAVVEENRIIRCLLDPLLDDVNNLVLFSHKNLLGNLCKVTDKMVNILRILRKMPKKILSILRRNCLSDSYKEESEPFELRPKEQSLNLLSFILLVFHCQ